MADKFKYNYSAPTPAQRREIERIRGKYQIEEKSFTKLDELKKIDNFITSVKTSIAIAFGIIGTLIFGTGMVFFLEWTTYWYFGIPFALFGSLIVIINYPLYLLISRILKINIKIKS